LRKQRAILRNRKLGKLRSRKQMITKHLRENGKTENHESKAAGKSKCSESNKTTLKTARDER
jgi:hypothetical protein